MMNTDLIRFRADERGYASFSEVVELINHIAQLEKENASLKQERAELACAAMEAVDMLWDDDNEGAYEHLVENFEDIYNET